MIEVIVTGTGRSGTSLMGEFLRLCGHDPGGDWRKPNNSGREDPVVCKLIARMTEDLKGRRSLSRSYVDEIRAINRTVIKHPAIIRDSRITELWMQALPRAGFLLMYRSLEEVVRSAARLNRTTDQDLLEGRLFDFLELATRRERVFRVLKFPECVNQPKRVIEALSRLGLTLPENAPQIWSQLASLKVIKTSRK